VSLNDAALTLDGLNAIEPMTTSAAMSTRIGRGARNRGWSTLGNLTAR
jgi:hypothetical protein